MIVLRTIMNVLPEKQKEVLQTLISLIDQTRNKSGCLAYGIFCDIEDKNIFNLLSEWKTRQDLDQYISSNIFTVFAWNQESIIRTMGYSNLYGFTY